MAIRSRDVVMVVALASAASWATWLWARHTFELGSSWTDGSAVYDTLGGERIRYAVWDRPEALSAILDEGEGAARPALSPDGRLIVFSVGERGLNADLFVAELPFGLDGEPAAPRPLARLNTADDELAPAFGPDGLYFATDRAGTGKLDIWHAAYDGGGFATPQPLARGVNSGADETDPFPLADGGLLFASDRPRAARVDYDLYRATRVAAEPDTGRTFRVEPIGALNTPFDEREPAVTTDGRTLVFASNRDGTRGGFDLFRSFLEDDGWLAPEPLHGVNTTASERGPLPSPDGFALLFDRAHAGDLTSLWRARSRELFRVPGAPIGWKELLLLLALLTLALLAWAARRWKTLEVIYKCFLVSLIAHLLLMYWLRGVVPETEPVELAGTSRVFQVRLAGSQGARSTDRERGGQLQTERSAETHEHNPNRLEESQSALSAADVRISAAEFSELRAAPATAPERATLAADATAAAAARQRSASTTLKDREARAAPRSGTAPTFTLVAQAGTAEPAPLATGAPSRARNAPARQIAEEPSSLHLEVDRSAAQPAAGDAPRAQPLRAPAVASTGTSSATAVALAEPRETFDARDGAAPSFELPTARTGERERTRSDDALASRAKLTGSAGESSAAPATTSFATRQQDAPQRPTAPAPQAAPSRLTGPAGSAPTVAVRDISAGPPQPERVEANQPVRFDPLQGLARAEPMRPKMTPVAAPAPIRLERTPDPLAGGTNRSSTAALGSAPAARSITLAPVAAAPDDRPKRLEQTPYKNRFGDEKLRALEEFGGGVETERAVAAGLAYLAEIQSTRGYWGSRNDYDDKYEDVRIGKTGLALLAFLGAGHTPHSQTEFTGVTQRAVDFLLGQFDARSGHFGESASYGHGIATYALAECYALTKEPILAAPLERAVDHILDNQITRGSARSRGGWGYYYDDGRIWNGDRWPRVSVTAWQIMALESARIGGIEVPDRAFELARSFLLAAWDSERGAFRYSHDPARLRSGYPILPASTPAALFGLSLLGIDLQSDELREARRFVTSRRPRAYRYDGDDDFVLRGRGNLYFWYYGTLAMFRAGGSDWRRWNTAMKETLLESQQRNGSWQPISIYARFAGDDDRDRSYTTAMCVLTLEIYYRYFTPLLQVR